VVMSRIALRPATPDTEVSAEPLETLADRLVRETTDGDIWVFGGGEVARAFLAAGRLDTLELCVVPVLLGDGIALFGSGIPASNLRLTMSRQYWNGLVRVDYDILRDN
jgi:dihydrofolate reductase